jgi:hypothetical protein
VRYLEILGINPT